MVERVSSFGADLNFGATLVQLSALIDGEIHVIHRRPTHIAEAEWPRPIVIGRRPCRRIARESRVDVEPLFGSVGTIPDVAAIPKEDHVTPC